MIDALPAAEDLDLSYAAAVAEAQDAFNTLSDEDKALVSELKQQKLEAAVLKIAELKKEAASTIEEAFSSTRRIRNKPYQGQRNFRKRVDDTGSCKSRQAQRRNKGSILQ